MLVACQRNVKQLNNNVSLELDFDVVCCCQYNVEETLGFGQKTYNWMWILRIFDVNWWGWLTLDVGCFNVKQLNNNVSLELERCLYVANTTLKKRWALVKRPTTECQNSTYIWRKLVRFRRWMLVACQHNVKQLNNNVSLELDFDVVCMLQIQRWRNVGFGQKTYNWMSEFYVYLT